jgi:hypothetical protein
LGYQEFVDYVSSEDWSYFDWKYVERLRFDQTTRYTSNYVYYGVMAAKLPRPLPNVFFDSKISRGHQFWLELTGAQRHRLEGDFDKYFRTYFAKDYAIDSLSFITPDVMEALIAASEYDIEIVGDRVLFYGPIYVDITRLDDMAAKLKRVQAQLAHNARTYHDNHAPAAERATKVAPEGRYFPDKPSV